MSKQGRIMKVLSFIYLCGWLLLGYLYARIYSFFVPDAYREDIDFGGTDLFDPNLYDQD